MFEPYYQWDLKALYQLNVAWASPDSDQFWLTITHLHKVPWVIYGIFPAILIWLFYIYRLHALKPLLVLAVVVGLTDVLCYRGIKSYVHRPRPFENVEISSWLRKVGDAHGPSFPSNHAANTFAGACILAWFWRRQRYLFYTLAAFVALSRPALGVHYPSDALAGAIIGIFVASLFRAFVLNQTARFILPIRVSKEADKNLDWRSRVGREF